MTKAELIEAMKNMPDDCEIVFWDSKMVTPETVDCDGVHIYLEGAKEVFALND